MAITPLPRVTDIHARESRWREEVENNPKIPQVMESTQLIMDPSKQTVVGNVARDRNFLNRVSQILGSGYIAPTDRTPGIYGDEAWKVRIQAKLDEGKDLRTALRELGASSAQISQIGV